MSWLYYLLEANLYLILFYGFYRLFLHRETFYGLNRSYLIFSSILAFVFPFVQLGFLMKEMVFHYTGYIRIDEPKSYFTLENVLLALYLSISTILILKVLWGLRYLVKLMRNAHKRREDSITLIEIKNSKVAFSFFNLLFIDPEMNQKATVLKHEMVHIKQKHSLDIILFELIQISSWFNPVIYFIKNDIKLVHEYLADEATTKKDMAKYDYALFLIQNSYGNQSVTLSNHFFNSSLLKNRISMLNQTKSTKWARLKLLFIIPLAGFMLCLSTTAFTKDYSTIQLGQKKQSLTIVLQDTTRKKSDKKRLPPPPPKEPGSSQSKKITEIKINEPMIKKNDRRLPPPPPVEPHALKAKKITEQKGNQIRFAPPVVKKDSKKSVPPPPPVEVRPIKSGNDSETIKVSSVINDNNRAQSIKNTSPAGQKDVKSVTVVGYPSTGNKIQVPVKQVKGIKMEEITIEGYPSKKQ
ncbi:M56 family metallopeptidase [Pedobacter sp. KACC 23697]|uniref:M56 family metallopeptidase n=1 Tax=Pedobacter sp. KACC 23697 TaxID=3149230 RepID=A0AAU7KC84_9SPHI